MNKLLINVTSPYIGKTHEMYIPCEMKVSEITALLKTYMLKDYSVDRLSLCYMKDGAIIPSNLYIYETSLMNGDTVLLM